MLISSRLTGGSWLSGAWCSSEAAPPGARLLLKLAGERPSGDMAADPLDMAPGTADDPLECRKDPRRARDSAAASSSASCSRDQLAKRGRQRKSETPL